VRNQIIALVTLAVCFSPASLHAEEVSFSGDYVRYQAPEFLSFEELKKLSKSPFPDISFRSKMHTFFNTPIISNEAYYEGYRPRRFKDKRLGPFLRIASWNIEKSLNIPQAISALTSAEDYKRYLDLESAPQRSLKFHKALMQRSKLAMADCIILQEMDIGVKRSGYRDAARTLAKALHMNYAYGPEQLEIDPVLLGTEKISYKDGGTDQEATDYYKADPSRYKGVFGSAVLSRYPIKHAEVFQLKNQAYDWYHQEKEKTSFLEDTRRFGTETVFKNQITREMKVGGRIFFRVDLEVPELPEGTLTIINIHLEIKCAPKGRQAQIAEILYAYLKKIKNPVIVAGDFNSSEQDLSPTSTGRVVKNYATNPTNWLSAAVSYVVPQALIVNASRLASNVTKNFQDPTATDIPIIAPNSQRKMFDLIRDHRFDDGGAFDFRGDRLRSTGGKSGTLANSNERDFKGFKTTFSVKRPIGPLIGKERLDWIFVKSYTKDPKRKTQSYRFAPHFGSTLEEMNSSLLVPISDHHPIIVDLPFEEPDIKLRAEG
jgi:endonuclease/exonuclease/phosphatase family metal-dependent hydrolase